MEDSSVENFKHENPFLGKLSEKEVLALKSACHQLTYMAGETIYKQNVPVSHLMYVQSGLIKLYKEAGNGNQVILTLSTPGNFLGLLSAFSGDPYHSSAMAIENSRILLIDISLLKLIINDNGAFALVLLKQASKNGIDILSQHIDQFQKQLPGRVAEMLLFFSEKIYNSTKFTLPLSRTELAQFAGTTRESMIRTLSEFRHDKIISLDGKKVEILSPELIQILRKLG